MMNILERKELEIQLERLIIGLEEPVLIKGLGSIVAKIDSGNAGFNVLHGEDFQQEGNMLSFTTITGENTKKRVQYPVETYIDVNIGGGNIQHRPVVLLDIKFANEEYRKIPFSITDRSTNDRPILISKQFVQDELDALIDVSKTNISQDNIQAEIIGEASNKTDRNPGASNLKIGQAGADFNYTEKNGGILKFIDKSSQTMRRIGTGQGLGDGLIAAIFEKPIEWLWKGLKFLGKTVPLWLAGITIGNLYRWIKDCRQWSKERIDCRKIDHRLMMIALRKTLSKYNVVDSDTGQTEMKGKADNNPRLQKWLKGQGLYSQWMLDYTGAYYCPDQVRNGNGQGTKDGRTQTTLRCEKDRLARISELLTVAKEMKQPEVVNAIKKQLKDVKKTRKEVIKPRWYQKNRSLKKVPLSSQESEEQVQLNDSNDIQFMSEDEFNSLFENMLTETQEAFDLLGAEHFITEAVDDQGEDQGKPKMTTSGNVDIDNLINVWPNRKFFVLYLISETPQKNLFETYLLSDKNWKKLEDVCEKIMNNPNLDPQVAFTALVKTLLQDIINLVDNRSSNQYATQDQHPYDGCCIFAVCYGDIKQRRAFIYESPHNLRFLKSNLEDSMYEVERLTQSILDIKRYGDNIWNYDFINNVPGKNSDSHLIKKLGLNNVNGYISDIIGTIQDLP